MRDFESLCRTPEWVREMRADMAYWGITNIDIAEKIGISGALVGMILSGAKTPDGSRNGITKEDIVKAEAQIRDSRKKSYEKWKAKNGGEA